MKNISLILLLFFAFSLNAQLQLDWSFSQGSKVSDFTGTMEADDQGNLYVVSEFADTADLDPGPDVDLVFPQSSNALTLSKISNKGEYQWSNQFFGKEEISGGIFEVKYSHLKLGVSFRDSLFYQSAGQLNTLYEGTGNYTAILTLNTDGSVSDIYVLPGSFQGYFTDIYSPDQERTLIAGSFFDTIQFGNQSPVTLIATGDPDAYIVMLDHNYEPVWTTQFSSPGENYLEDIAVKNDQNIYFAITHTDTLIIHTLHGTKVFPDNGEDNAVYGMMTIDGAMQDAFGFGGDLGDQVRGIEADDEGNMYIVGYFEGTVNFAHPDQVPVWATSTANDDGFLSKYNPAGQLVWTRIFKTTDYGGVYTLDLKRGNELYISGGYAGIADLDPGTDSIIAVADFYTDVFISKFSLDGDMFWSYHFRGPDDDEGIRSLNIDTKDSRVTLLGYFYGTLDCDFTSDELLLTTNGGSDVFFIGFTESNVISGIDGEVESNLIVYPNPTSDLLTIHSELPFSEATLYDLNGKWLMTGKADYQNTFQFNLNPIPPGVYVLELKMENHMEVRKVMVNH